MFCFFQKQPGGEQYSEAVSALPCRHVASLSAAVEPCSACETSSFSLDLGDRFKRYLERKKKRLYLMIHIHWE